MKEDNEA